MDKCHTEGCGWQNQIVLQIVNNEVDAMASAHPYKGENQHVLYEPSKARENCKSFDRNLGRLYANRKVLITGIIKIRGSCKANLFHERTHLDPRTCIMLATMRSDPLTSQKFTGSTKSHTSASMAFIRGISPIMLIKYTVLPIGQPGSLN